MYSRDNVTYNENLFRFCFSEEQNEEYKDEMRKTAIFIEL